MRDKHDVEVKIGDKLIGIDMDMNPPLHIGKIAWLSVGSAIIISEAYTDRRYRTFYSYEFELWTPERELIAKLEI